MKEFDFLPDLPKPNLDDREFDDLVKECLLRIPRYCPEWTNHNPSDPGVTLIELFAWLTDRMQKRFNQVPLRNYIAFLELLGIKLLPPVPAQTELTFYINRVRSSIVRIGNKTEVAIDRQNNREEVVFTTDREIAIGTPIIKHLLIAKKDVPPSQTRLRDRTPTPEIGETELTPQRWWRCGESDDICLFEEPSPGNCFYLILEELEPETSVMGNVVSLVFRGEAAMTTGIDPNDPPLRWEAWNGEEWQFGILRRKEDDGTKGFSFDRSEEQVLNPLIEGAEVVLHLPLKLPKTNFGTEYSGHWIRCVYKDTGNRQIGYTTPPSIIGLSSKAIGGAVLATECIRIEHELLGVSNGKPGQNFQLQKKPVLQRKKIENEHIEIRLPDGSIEIWEEVDNFANSTSEDRHYTIDSRTGIVQFGPLVREPFALQQKTLERLKTQSLPSLPQIEEWEYRKSRNRHLAALEGSDKSNLLERQYGRIPVANAEIYMAAYRTGGGSKGNVKANSLNIVKTAIPYVKAVTNHRDARGGVDAESLTDAVLKVPNILRVRECAVTPEEFESAAARAHKRVARAHCVTDVEYHTPGLVTLLIIPGIEINPIDFQQDFPCGLNAHKYFTLDKKLEEEILFYLRERKPLGIKLELRNPDYVRVKVEVEVIVERQYSNVGDRAKVHSLLLAALYRFLNPLTGGLEGKGWPLGCNLYPSDIVSICRTVPGVNNIGTVKLFKITETTYGSRQLETLNSQIELDNIETICSWSEEDEVYSSGHIINFIN